MIRQPSVPQRILVECPAVETGVVAAPVGQPFGPQLPSLHPFGPQAPSLQPSGPQFPPVQPFGPQVPPVQPPGRMPLLCEAAGVRKVLIWAWATAAEVATARAAESRVVKVFMTFSLSFTVDFRVSRFAANERDVKRSPCRSAAGGRVFPPTRDLSSARRQPSAARDSSAPTAVQKPPRRVVTPAKPSAREPEFRVGSRRGRGLFARRGDRERERRGEGAIGRSPTSGCLGAESAARRRPTTINPSHKTKPPPAEPGVV